MHRHDFQELSLPQFSVLPRQICMRVEYRPEKSFVAPHRHPWSFMDTNAKTIPPLPTVGPAEGTALAILFAISFSHMLNDMMQSLIFALYPMLKVSHNLSFSQIGLITLTYQITASLLQPVVGLYTDRRPQPYSLAIGMDFASCICWSW